MVGFGICKYFDYIFSFYVGFCMRVGVEGEGFDVVRGFVFFELLFVLVDLCDFGVGVYDGWDGGVVDVIVVFFDVFDNSDGFFFGFVCKYGVEGGVINVVDVGDFGLVFGIDDDMVVVVKFYVNVFEVEIIGVRVMVNGVKDNFSFKLDICVRKYNLF